VRKRPQLYFCLYLPTTRPVVSEEELFRWLPERIRQIWSQKNANFLLRDARWGKAFDFASGKHAMVKEPALGDLDGVDDGA